VCDTNGEVASLAAAAAAALAGGAGLEVAEKVIRAGLLRLCVGVLEDLLAADLGYTGPRADCGRGHYRSLTAGVKPPVPGVRGACRAGSRQARCPGRPGPPVS